MVKFNQQNSITYFSFRDSNDSVFNMAIRSYPTTLYVVFESNLLLNLLQSSGLQNNLWLTTFDPKGWLLHALDTSVYSSFLSHSALRESNTATLCCQCFRRWLVSNFPLHGSLLTAAHLDRNYKEFQHIQINSKRKCTGLEFLGLRFNIFLSQLQWDFLFLCSSSSLPFQKSSCHQDKVICCLSQRIIQNNCQT